MASRLIVNIQQLVNCRNESHLLRGNALAGLPVAANAYLLTEDDEIAAFGTMEQLQGEKYTSKPGSVIDASGAMVLPCWCDSHTHLVFAGSREDEFVDKIKGLSYAEIAAVAAAF